MTARLPAFILVAGLMSFLVVMLCVAMAAYYRRVKQLKGMPNPAATKALPIHVLLISASYLLSKLLNFATIAYDTYDPIYQFPFWIRIPWDTVATSLGIAALWYLLTYERFHERENRKKQSDSLDSR